MKLAVKIAVYIFLGTILGILWSNYLIIPTLDSLFRDPPSDDFFSKRFPELTKISLVYLFGIYPTSVLVCVLVIRSVLNPILKITKTAKEVASGFLASRIDISSKDEIGDLANTLNVIIQNLSSALQNMANAVRDEKKKETLLTNTLLKIEKEKAKDDAILSSIGEGVAAVDESGSIILFNNAASQIIGCEVVDAVGKKYFEVLHFAEEEADVASMALEQDFIKMALEGNKSTLSEKTFIVTKKGERVPVSESANPIVDKNNKVLGAVIVFRDITRQRNLEKMKDEFVSIASHELRTPMSAIKGLVSMVMEGDYGPVGSELKDPLNDIYLSTERLINLVNDLLDVSRIEEGRLKLVLSNFDINQGITEVINLLNPMAQQKGIYLEFQSQPNSPHVQGDPDKLEEILNNLIGNSIKFTDNGGVTVSYKQMEGLMLVYVSDTGIGIPPEKQDKLFGKFVQIASTEKGRPWGTGLGLYLSKELAKRMGGDVWLSSSELGMGSTFIFSMPVAGSPAAKEVSDRLKIGQAPLTG